MGGREDLDFTWDEAKAASNLRKHGVSFPTATFVFDDPFRMDEPDGFAIEEYRSAVIGRIGRSLVAVIYTEPEPDLVRIVSARLATPFERRNYERRLFHS